MTKKDAYRGLLVLLVLNIFLSYNVNAETIIYDNATTSQYKTIKIASDTMNIELVNEYKYEVYLDGNFLGYYEKNENIFVPDNSNVSIWIPSPTKTDLSNVYGTVIVPTLITFLGFMTTWGLLFVITTILIWKIWNMRK